MSKSSVKCTPHDIKAAFRWRCAVCHRSFPHPSCSKDLQVHYIDLDPKHRRPQNMMAVCRRCRGPLQEEASQYFHQNYPQLSLLPNIDYRNHLEDLWVLGLQMDFFEEFLDSESLTKQDNRLNIRSRSEQLRFSGFEEPWDSAENVDLPLDSRIFSENHA